MRPAHAAEGVSLPLPSLQFSYQEQQPAGGYAAPGAYTARPAGQQVPTAQQYTARARYVVPPQPTPRFTPRTAAAAGQLAGSSYAQQQQQQQAGHVIARGYQPTQRLPQVYGGGGGGQDPARQQHQQAPMSARGQASARQPPVNPYLQVRCRGGHASLPGGAESAAVSRGAAAA